MTVPILDVVVTTHSAATWLRLCLEAIRLHTRSPYRLIVVASGVTDEVVDVLHQSGIRAEQIVRTENKSFSNNINRGVAAGSAEYIALVDDDTIVHPGWDVQLIKDASSGIAGARSQTDNGGPQGNPAQRGTPSHLAAFCMCFKRELFNALGPWDEEIFDGFHESDLDYSWRALKAGYALKVSNARCYHVGRQSNIENRDENQTKYLARLTTKWGVEWIKKIAELNRSEVLIVPGNFSWLIVIEHGYRLDTDLVQKFIDLNKDVEKIEGASCFRMSALKQLDRTK